MKIFYKLLLQTVSLLIFALQDVASLDVLSGLTGAQSEPAASDPDNSNNGTAQFYESDGTGYTRSFTLEDLPGCGLNEYYEFCGSTCLDSCKALRFNFTAPEDCGFFCEEGCFCKPGYRRHPSTRSCILDSCCPAKDPDVYYPCDNSVKYCGGLYEVFREEFNECLESCDINPLVCSYDVLYRGCFCEDGFKRNYHGVCVPEMQCYYKEDGYIYQSKEYGKLKENYYY